MSYKDQVRQQIKEIEQQISQSHVQNLELENKLLKLRLAELEEDMREETNTTTLLKG